MNDTKFSKLPKFFFSQDLFPKANLGLGPHECLPYSYEAFVIAARYFPEFGAEAPLKVGCFFPRSTSFRFLHFTYIEQFK